MTDVWRFLGSSERMSSYEAARGGCGQGELVQLGVCLSDVAACRELIRRLVPVLIERPEREREVAGRRVFLRLSLPKTR